VGDETFAIGYPLGLDKTVTRGIVSGMGNRHSQYVAHVQTDAAINPGNSGGPLFNERGEVVGMNSFIATRTGGSQGLGFAIIGPDLARSVAQFAATHDISSGRLGIIANLSDPLKPEAGLLIEYVRPGSGAQKAGLQRGDLIMRIASQQGGDQLLVNSDGEHSARAIAGVLARSFPGQKVHMTVLRGEQTVTVEVTIDAKPSYPSR
jgi:S1-C subfamily serine protease